MKKHVLLGLILIFSWLQGSLFGQCPITAFPSNFNGGTVNLNVSGNNFNGDIWQITSSGDDIWYDFTESPFNKNTTLSVYGNGSVTVGYFSDFSSGIPDCEITFTINNSICSDTPITVPCTLCNPTCQDCPPPTILNNPILDPNTDCNDLEIALILDESGSMSGFESQVKDGVITFLRALSCTGAELVFYEFDEVTRVVEANYRVIDNALIDDIEDYFDQVNQGDENQYNPGGGTNWQNAINMLISDINSGLTLPDLTLFLTDGNPTFNDNTFDANCQSGAGSADLPDIMNAMLAANDLKSIGSHLFVLGLGGNLEVSNMKRVTGSIEYQHEVTTIQNSDFALEDFEELAECLAFFADELCGFESSALSNNDCGNNSNGQIAIIGPAGNTSYTYELFRLEGGSFISEGAPVNASGRITISGLEAGEYRIEVNINISPDCMRTETIFETITGFPDVVCQVNQATPPSCSNDGLSEDGAIEITLTSGTPPFSFTLNSVAIVPTANGNGVFTIDGLSSGTYEIEVTDPNGCNSVCSEVTLIDRTIPSCSATGGELTCSANFNSIDCNH